MNELELTDTMTKERLIEIAQMVLDTYKIHDWKQYYICWRVQDLESAGKIDSEEMDGFIYSLFFMLPYQHRLSITQNHNGDTTDYPWFDDDYDKESRIELLNELIKACKDE